MCAKSEAIKYLVSNFKMWNKYEKGSGHCFTGFKKVLKYLFVQHTAMELNLKIILETNLLCTFNFKNPLSTDLRQPYTHNSYT